MIRFYDVALSPYAQKVKIALLEKGLAFESRVPQLGEVDAEFAAVNPRGEVPALVDEGTAIFDSSIILEYLEDRWPEPPLRPAAAADRARVRMLEEVCDTQYEAINWGLTEVIVFKRADGELAQTIMTTASRESRGLCGWLTRRLGSRPWFNGDAFGLGDIVVWPYVQTSSLYKMGPEPGSPLDGWLTRMRERASVQRTVEEAKAAVGAFRELGRRIMSGRAPRQYRDHRLEFLMRAGGAGIVQKGMAEGTIRFSTLPSG